MLHRMIRNEKLQHCSNTAARCCAKTRRCNRPLWYHIQVIYSRLSDGKDVAIAAHTVWEPGCFLRGSFTNFILFNTFRFRGQASILEKES